jgi:hypothetical protein
VASGEFAGLVAEADRAVRRLQAFPTYHHRHQPDGTLTFTRRT